MAGGAGDGSVWGHLDDYHDPFHHVDHWHHSTHVSFWFGTSFSFGCHGWWWPTYFGCWWPYWYWRYYYPVYYPAYYATPSYAPTTVIVESGDSVPAREVVYEDVAPRNEVQAGHAQRTSTSIAAERYLTLGDRAFQEARYSDAVQLYAKAVDFAPNDAALYLVLGDALFAAGDYHYAAYVLRKAFELDSTLVNTTVDKHDFYQDPAEFDRQLAVLERYLLDHPTDRDARLVLAVNYLFAGRPTDTADVLRRPEASSLVAEEIGNLVLRAAEGRLSSTPR